MIMTSHFGGAWRRSVVLLFVALFGLPAVGYGAGTSFVFSKGYKAYEAKDYARARTLFDQACKSGWAVSCFNAGAMFNNGEGGAQDQARARTLFDQACKGGNAQGCSYLGHMFDTGVGVKGYAQF